MGNPRLVLCIPVGRDFRLLPRTLAYYASMGIDDVWLNVHARPEWGIDFLQTIGRIADAHGARVARVHAYPYIESNLTTRQMIEERANPGDWILYSDADEFQVYPNGPRHALELCRQHGCDFLWGALIDRISGDGRLHLLNDRSLWNQFPLRAWVTGHVRRGDARKVVLARAEIVLGGGQHFAGNGRGLPVELCQAVVHHFRWDHDTVRSARYFQRVLEQYGAHWSAEYQRLLEYLDSHEGRFDVSEPGLGCCVDPYFRTLQSDTPGPAAAAARPASSPTSEEQAQIELLRGLDIVRNPDLYRDPDACQEILRTIRSFKYDKTLVFHYYWREAGHLFGEKQLAALTSFLATQDLRFHKAVLWYVDEAMLGRPGLDGLIAEGVVEPRYYDPFELAEGTPLAGADHLLRLRDDSCYLDGDLLRLLVLYRCGGVYADMDVLLLRDLSPLLPFEFMYSWGATGHINGAIMRFFSGSPFIHTMLELIRDSRPQAGTNCWGAGTYTQARQRFGVTVLPYAFFNPEWVWFDRKVHSFAENPETFMRANPASANIYEHAFAWHWHNKWEQEIEPGSKFDILTRRISARWEERARAAL